MTDFTGRAALKSRNMFWRAVLGARQNSDNRARWEDSVSIASVTYKKKHCRRHDKRSVAVLELCSSSKRPDSLSTRTARSIAPTRNIRDGGVFF